MAEYIERTERLILALNAGARAIENNKRLSGAAYVMDVFSDSPKEIPYYEAAILLRDVSEVPAAEVEPVRHGRWIATAYTTTSKRGRIISNVKYTCSECEWGNGRKRSNYCAVRGARMDGGADNDE